MIRTEHQIEMDRYIAMERSYKPNILAAMKNTLRCAGYDAESARHAFEIARLRLGKANKARVESDGFSLGRKEAIAEAMRELNKARRLLRLRMAVFNAAWDALRLWPGVGASVIRQMW